VTPERGATEGEALAAQRAMFVLLAKHNLTLAQVGESKTATEDRAVGQQKYDAGLFAWETYLWQSIAHLNFCEYLRGHSRQHLIIGTKANTVTTQEMASYVVETICKLASAAAEKQPPKERWQFMHDFRQGCAGRLRSRIEKLQQEARAGSMKAADPDSLLPALANLYDTAQTANDAFIKSAYGKTRKGRAHSRSIRNGAGYMAGSKAGESIRLNKQVGEARLGPPASLIHQ
jgi:hypothetical protein